MKFQTNTLDVMIDLSDVTSQTWNWNANKQSKGISDFWYGLYLVWLFGMLSQEFVE